MPEFIKKSWEAVDWEADNGGLDWNVWGPKGSNHSIGSDLEGQFGSKAEAQLIAAAPDLYDALSKIVQAVCGETGFASAVRRHSGTAYPWEALDIAEALARAALSKADGGSNEV